MSQFIASWLTEASEILGPELSCPVDILPGAVIPATATTLTFVVDIAGDWSGTFAVTVDEKDLARLFGASPIKPAESEDRASGNEVREHWERLLGRICIAAAASLGAKSNRACEVAMISREDTPVGSGGMGYQLRAGESGVAMMIEDQVEAAQPDAREQIRTRASGGGMESATAIPAYPPASEAVASTKSVGELWLDVELEASLRFGSREMPLSELLALGPGDVVQLDRALADPVDLIIGDKIVARGEVVLVNGNFGLQVTEVAEPRKSLESIRCLF